jgi:hypothetical protein
VRQRHQKLRDRYKLGFDRLAVVALVAFAVVFGAVALVVNDPYGLPEEGTGARRAIEAEVAAECAADQVEALATLCRERVMASYRWAHYTTALGADDRGWLLGLLLAAVALAAAIPAARWVIAGFRTPQPASRDPAPPDRLNRG